MGHDRIEEEHLAGDIDDTDYPRSFQNRIWVLREKIRSCETDQDVAEMFMILAEGLHEQVFSSAAMSYDRKKLRVRVSCKDPPIMVVFGKDF